MKASSRTLLAAAVSMGLGVFSGPEANPAHLSYVKPAKVGIFRISRNGGKGYSVAHAKRAAIKRRHKNAQRAIDRRTGGRP